MDSVTLTPSQKEAPMARWIDPQYYGIPGDQIIAQLNAQKAARQEPPRYEKIVPEDLSRATTIATLRRNLRGRSARRWSITGGRGTSSGWVKISTSPTGSMTADECQELAALLGLDDVHHQGYRIPAAHDYYREAIDRTAGLTPAKLAMPYWD
jgi:hypothetical protein